MIKNIVFDMGNVLLTYDVNNIVKNITVNADEQDILKTYVFDTDEWVALNKGTINTNDAITSICKKTDVVYHNIIRIALLTWYNYLTPVCGMDDIVLKLKENNYCIYLLSNVSQDFHVFKTMIPSHHCFAGFFISSDWKVSKPDEIIFSKFVHHFSLKVEECFFIDDTKANIEVANKVGMATHLFSGNINNLLIGLRQREIISV